MGEECRTITVSQNSLLLIKISLGIVLLGLTTIGIATMPDNRYEDVLSFWFGEQKDGYPIEDRGSLWFQGAPKTDHLIRKSFGSLVEQALKQELSSWEKNPKSQLALIILLDQFTRSIYRQTPQAFSGDHYALHLSRTMITKGWDKKLTFSERQFAYMPLMHSEKLEDQNLCIERFTTLKNDAPDEKKALVERSIWFANNHRELIIRFGRFPHRNKSLGRVNSPEEKAYLSNDPNSYGQ